MKLSNLRLGPVEPGGTLTPVTLIAEEREPARDHIPAAPSGRRDIRRTPDPAKSGFSGRRPPGRAAAAAVTGAALLLVAGIVLISTIMADRTIVQRTMPSVASSGTARGPTGDAASGNGATTMDVPPDPQPWGQPQPRNVPQPSAPVAAASPTPAALPPPPVLQPRLDSSPPAQAAPPVLAPGAMPQAARPEASPPPPDPAMLIARGDEYFAGSDVVAARLFYRRAFDGGSTAAAAAMGSTFDPIIIEQRNVRGVRADPAEALQWYRRAARLGNADADARGLALIAYLRARAANGDTEARAILERALR